MIDIDIKMDIDNHLQNVIKTFRKTDFYFQIIDIIIILGKSYKYVCQIRRLQFFPYPYYHKIDYIYLLITYSLV